jgi:hypothetical protein
VIVGLALVPLAGVPLLRALEPGSPRRGRLHGHGAARLRSFPGRRSPCPALLPVDVAHYGASPASGTDGASARSGLLARRAPSGTPVRKGKR